MNWNDCSVPQTHKTHSGQALLSMPVESGTESGEFWAWRHILPQPAGSWGDMGITSPRPTWPMWWDSSQPGTNSNPLLLNVWSNCSGVIESSYREVLERSLTNPGSLEPPETQKYLQLCTLWHQLHNGLHYWGSQRTSPLSFLLGFINPLLSFF